MSYKLNILKNLALFTSLSTVLLQASDVLASGVGGNRSTMPFAERLKAEKDTLL